MTIEIDRIKLLQGLKKVVPIATQKNRNGVLQFSSTSDGIRIAAHNSQTYPTLSVAVFIPAMTETFDSFCVDAYRLYRFIHAINDDVRMNVGEQKLSVMSGKNRSFLALGNPDNFTQVKSPKNLVTTIPHNKIIELLSIVDIPDPSTIEGIKSSAFFMVHSDTIQMVATDGYRAGHIVVEHESHNTLEMLLPVSLLSALKDSYWDGGIDVHVEKNIVFFSSQDFYIYGAKIALQRGEYPKEFLIKQLRDEFDTGILINPEILNEKLIACAAMSAGGKKDIIPVHFMIANQQLILQSEENEMGQMTFTIPVNKQVGDDMDFWVNSNYISFAIELIDKLSTGGLESIYLYLGKTTTWVFVTKAGLDNARYAFARLAR
jgi:DNA polymerase III sliding clamp (beta) subunit (PCNA family)